MRKYEIMYIMRPNMEEEAQKALVERFNTILTDNGAAIEKVTEMGKRRLAYEIEDFREGVYMVLNVSSNGEAISEFERLSLINEDMLRHIVIKEEE